MENYCVNTQNVDYLIKNEPHNFYSELYTILEKDCETFDLNYFKHFYIVKRLPLFNQHKYIEPINIINEKLNNCNDETKNRILASLQEDTIGHNLYGICDKCNLFNITKYNILTAPHITINMAHLITALKCNIDVKDYDLILEFGGGYGGMAKICNSMGFNNMYYIYDLPQIKKIQQFHLEKLNIKHTIVDDVNNLKNIVTSEFSKKKLFIATWSLSEVDDNLREKIVDIIKDFDSVLIIFQHNNPFNNNNNYNYFYSSGLFQERFKKIQKWYLENIPYIPWDGGSSYFIGN